MEDMKVFLVEDCDSETKMEMYKELVMSVANRDVPMWGQGFSIDEFLWCWRIDLFAGEGK